MHLLKNICVQVDLRSANPRFSRVNCRVTCWSPSDNQESQAQSELLWPLRRHQGRESAKAAQLPVSFLQDSFSEIHAACRSGRWAPSGLVAHWEQKTPPGPWPTSHPKRELLAPNVQPRVTRPLLGHLQ